MPFQPPFELVVTSTSQSYENDCEPLDDGFAPFGNLAIIDHGVGVFSAYAHLQSFAVQAGQNVRKGDLIGHMGQSGYVTGPHLHWEAIVHGVRVDARLFTLPGEEP